MLPGSISKIRAYHRPARKASRIPGISCGRLWRMTYQDAHKSTLLLELEKELRGRPIPEQTIAMVGHRSLFMMERWFGVARRVGIAVLVFGQHGSWLVESQHSRLPEQYLPINLGEDRDLPSRIRLAKVWSHHRCYYHNYWSLLRCRSEGSRNPKSTDLARRVIGYKC